MTGQTRRVLDFLSRTESYAHRPERVTMVQTHASWVFLAPPFVCKIKQPVNLGFLDFSSLELRRQDCEREVALNRRLAEDTYLGVEAIRESEGRLHFGGDGEVVEWCVMMRELDPLFFLSHRLREGGVTAADMDRIAVRLRDFHESQPPPPAAEVATAVDRLRLATNGNFEVAGVWVGRSLPREWFDAIVAFTEAFYRERGELLQSRVREGWIRDCHGDLHAEHIHLAPDAVRIYDCIEFNTRFRYIDIASDLAFLAMDLDYNGRPDLAGHLVRRFADLMKDAGMMALLDFYKCYRACVRGKVESLHSASETAGETERAESLDRARRYYRLALRYAVAGSAPCAMAFMGRIASGKSALAGALGEALGWTVLSSDRIRKTLAGIDPESRIDDAQRAALYAPGMTARTYETMFDEAGRLLGAGQSVVLDATFSKRADREALAERMRRAGFPLRWIEARVSGEVARERLRARATQPGVVSDARLEDASLINAGYEEPGEISDRITVTNEGPVAEVLGRLLVDLAERRARAVV